MKIKNDLLSLFSVPVLNMVCIGNFANYIAANFSDKPEVKQNILLEVEHTKPLTLISGESSKLECTVLPDAALCRPAEFDQIFKKSFCAVIVLGPPKDKQYLPDLVENIKHINPHITFYIVCALPILMSKDDIQTIQTFANERNIQFFNDVVPSFNMISACQCTRLLNVVTNQAIRDPYVFGLVSKERINQAFDEAIEEYATLLSLKSYKFISDNKFNNANAKMPKNITSLNCVSKLINFLNDPSKKIKRSSLEYLFVAKLTNKKATNDKGASRLVEQFLEKLKLHPSYRWEKLKRFHLFAQELGVPKELRQLIQQTYCEVESQSADQRLK